MLNKNKVANIVCCEHGQPGPAFQLIVCTHDVFISLKELAEFEKMPEQVQIDADGKSSFVTMLA